MTANLQKQINKLHRKVGALEWSGELITSEQGIITDLGNWVVTAHDIFIVDVGSPGFTSYEVDKGSFKSPDIVAMYEQFPGLMTGDLKSHHIHTHHNMGTFFSNTDWENLEDRAVVSNYFIMLIVNMKGDFAAKVAYKGIVNQVSEITFANNEDGYTNITFDREKNVEKLVVMNMEVVAEELEEEAPTWFDDRFSLVKETAKQEAEEAATAAKAKSAISVYPARTYYPPVGERTVRQTRMYEAGDGGYDEDYYEDVYGSAYKNGKWQGERKSITEMTDKEWAEFEKEHDRSNITLPQAYKLVNSVIYGNLATTDMRNPLLEMKKYDDLAPKMLIDKAEDMLFGLDAHMEGLFPGCSDEWCINSLKFLNDNIFDDAKHNSLAVALSRMIRAEIAKRERSTKNTTYKQEETWR